MAKDTGFNLWDSILYARKESPAEQQVPPEKKKTFPKTAIPEKPKWMEQPAQPPKPQEDLILEQAAAKMKKNLRSEYEAAIVLLKTIPGWKNADQLAAQCREAIAQRDKLEEAERTQQQRKDRKFHGKVKLVSAVLLAVAVAVGAHFVYQIITSVDDYQSPLSLVERGEYDKADQMLQEEIDKVGNIYWHEPEVYAVAESYAQQGEYQRAYNWYKKISAYKDARKKAEDMQYQIKLEHLKQFTVGSMIELGEFAINPMKWQPDQKAKWIILAIKETKALVVSRDILNVQIFRTKEIETNWTHSNLRSWLNTKFYVDAFSDKEKEVICMTQVQPDVNPKYSTENGNMKSNYIFLLSIAEVELCLPTEEARKAVATAYTREQGLENDRWLLRTMGQDGLRVTYVDEEGRISYEGQPTTQPGGVRPAMWVDLMQLYYP